MAGAPIATARDLRIGPGSMPEQVARAAINAGVAVVWHDAILNALYARRGAGLVRWLRTRLEAAPRSRRRRG